MKCIRLVHTYFPEWLYVCVVERQKRGAIHFHLGVKGYQDVDLLRSLWRCVAKYISKGLENELNEKRYRASLGIEIPKQISCLHPAINPMEYVIYMLESISGQVAYCGVLRRVKASMDGRVRGSNKNLKIVACKILYKKDKELF